MSAAMLIPVRIPFEDEELGIRARVPNQAAPSWEVRGVTISQDAQRHSQALLQQWAELLESSIDDDVEDERYPRGSEETNESDEEEDDEDDRDEEQETMAAKALVQAAMNRKIPPPVVKRLLFMESDSIMQRKRARVGGLCDSHHPSNVKNTFVNNNGLVRLSLSAPSLVSLHSQAGSQSLGGAPEATIKPDDQLRALLKTVGVQHQTWSALALNDFFVPVTEQAVQAYDMSVVNAVRWQHVEELQQIHREKPSKLLARNKFGESLLHAACRRSSLVVVQYLIQEANVPVQVCCDQGRTLLHDACWTPDSPDWTLMDVLLDECPDLLYTTDIRGATPLQYVRKEHWSAWNAYLQKRGPHGIRPRSLTLPPVMP